MSVTDQRWGRIRRSFAGRSLAELARRTGFPVAIVLVLLSAGLVVIAAGFGFALALEDVMEGDGIVGADPAVQRFLVQHRTSELTDLFRVLTRLGGPGVIATLGLVVVLFLAWRREWALAIGLVLVAGGTAVLVGIIKLLVDRSRPPPISRLAAATGASFPSGHSAEAIAFYGALAWIVVELVPTRRLRLLVCGAALGLGLLVGFSRAYLGVHWASDVISGWLLGLAWLAAVVAVFAVVPAMLHRDRAPGTGRSVSSDAC